MFAFNSVWLRHNEFRHLTTKCSGKKLHWKWGLDPTECLPPTVCSYALLVSHSGCCKKLLLSVFRFIFFKLNWLLSPWKNIDFCLFAAPVWSQTSMWVLSASLSMPAGFWEQHSSGPHLSLSQQEGNRRTSEILQHLEYTLPGRIMVYLSIFKVIHQIDLAGKWKHRTSLNQLSLFLWMPQFALRVVFPPHICSTRVQTKDDRKQLSDTECPRLFLTFLMQLNQTGPVLCHSRGCFWDMA